MKRFKPVSNDIYLICDVCRVVTDTPTLFSEEKDGAHLCQYCQRYAKNRPVVRRSGKKWRKGN